MGTVMAAVASNISIVETSKSLKDFEKRYRYRPLTSSEKVLQSQSGDFPKAYETPNNFTGGRLI
jgi:hypothetical protein